MALTNLQYGSLASSETLNNNFTYLDNRITTLSNSQDTAIATINSNIATINSNIAQMSEDSTEQFEEIADSITTINQNFSSGGLYITTYVNGNSWYREYFSDENKTTRIWLEQGGLSWNPTFIKEFSNTNYTVIAVGQTYQFAVRVTGRTTTKCTFEQWQTADGRTDSTAVFWYACGV